MRIREIEAKTLLSGVAEPDEWFGMRYSMNLYRGCQHQCIYCDTRSECYGIEDFEGEVLVKVNAIEQLKDQLPRKRKKGVVGLGSMNDAYMPIERTRGLARQALEVLARFRFPVHIITKSDLVVRDRDLLAQIGRVFAAVSFSITSAEDALCRQVEPGAPPASARFAAMRALAEAGIRTGVAIMPVLPFIEDNQRNIRSIVEQAADHGASYAIAGFGMTLRDRQRAYYYRELERLFPGLSDRCRRAFGNRYRAPARGASALEASFDRTCAARGLSPRFPGWEPRPPRQLPLL